MKEYTFKWEVINTSGIKIVNATSFDSACDLASQAVRNQLNMGDVVVRLVLVDVTVLS